MKTALAMMLIAVVALSGCANKTEKAKNPAEVSVEKSEALKEVMAFLTAHPPYYVSTISEDGKQPRVRPFSFVLEHEGRIYFATSTDKEIFRQLSKNKNIEVCTASATGEWIRIRGQVVFTEDLAIKQKAFEVATYLIPLYQDPQNPHFTMFYVDKGTASFNFSDGRASRLVNF